MLPTGTIQDELMPKLAEVTEMIIAIEETTSIEMTKELPLGTTIASEEGETMEEATNMWNRTLPEEEML